MHKLKEKVLNPLVEIEMYTFLLLPHPPLIACQFKILHCCKYIQKCMHTPRCVNSSYKYIIIGN